MVIKTLKYKFIFIKKFLKFFTNFVIKCDIQKCREHCKLFFFSFNFLLHMKRQFLHAFHSLELTRKNDFSQQNISLKWFISREARTKLIWIYLCHNQEVVWKIKEKENEDIRKTNLSQQISPRRLYFFNCEVYKFSHW